MQVICNQNKEIANPRDVREKNSKGNKFCQLFSLFRIQKKEEKWKPQNRQYYNSSQNGHIIQILNQYLPLSKSNRYHDILLKPGLIFETWFPKWLKKNALVSKEVK